MAKFYYNGVLLPEIPADVLALYRYCWIRKNTTSGYYDLVFAQYSWYWNGTEMARYTNNKSPWYRVEINTANAVTEWSHYQDTNANFGIDSTKTILWSNHNISNRSYQNSEIYFEATEPIPEFVEETYYQISSYTLTALGDQARRLNGGTFGKLTIAQMLEIFKNVSV